MSNRYFLASGAEKASGSPAHKVRIDIWYCRDGGQISSEDDFGPARVVKFARGQNEGKKAAGIEVCERVAFGHARRVGDGSAGLKPGCSDIAVAHLEARQTTRRRGAISKPIKPEIRLPQHSHASAIRKFKHGAAPHPRAHLSYSGASKRKQDGGLFGGYGWIAAIFLNDFNGKWRTEEDSNPRPPDS